MQYMPANHTAKISQREYQARDRSSSFSLLRSHVVLQGEPEKSIFYTSYACSYKFARDVTVIDI